MELKIYSLFSGSSGNCTWFKIGDLQFLIDAGGSCKAINDALRSLGSSLDKISHIFVTHEHSDHVKGLPVICKRFKPTLHINKGSFRNSTALCGALDPMLVDFLMADGTPVQLGEGVKVYAYKTPHDSYHSCAYVVECGQKRFAVATDMGYVTKGIAEILTGVEALILESNYDALMLKNGVYPEYLKHRIASDKGHLDNKIAARFGAYLAGSGTSCIVLGHLSEENNTPELALCELECQLKSENVPYYKAVENRCGVVENSVEIVEKVIKNAEVAPTNIVKTENFAVEENHKGVENLEKTVENCPKSADFGTLPVENSKSCNSFDKNGGFVENSLANVENCRKLRIAVASRHTPTMIFEGDV